jgi:pyruvate kinase
MSKIEFRHLSKRYGAHAPLTINDANITIEAGEFCVFVGPSGCGKSTLLRMVAGLEDISSGDLFIGGERVNDLPPARRGLAMVFQSYALYPHMTVRDNLAFGLKLGVDYIALSFVRTARDVRNVKNRIAETGRQIPIIAKIEKPQAVEALEEIIDAFDGVMVARGDLGVELPLEQVPLVQKRAVELSRRWAKPVIVATQMLETMISASRPTRAEASDVANAVLDGADALMLSGETSVGEYPIETVQTMARIIESTEENGLDRIPALGTKPHTHGGAVTLAAAEIAELLGSKFICVFTESGDSLRRVARLRHEIPTIAFTPSEETQRRLSLVWGSNVHFVQEVTHTDAMMHQVDEILLGKGIAKIGDEVVVVAGTPPGIPGSTNSLRVHRVGDAINGAAPAYAR